MTTTNNKRNTARAKIVAHVKDPVPTFQNQKAYVRWHGNTQTVYHSSGIIRVMIATATNEGRRRRPRVK